VKVKEKSSIILPLAIGVLVGEAVTVSGAFLFITAVALLCIYIIRRSFDDPAERSFVLGVFLAGLLLRFILCAAFYFIFEIKGRFYHYYGYAGNCLFGDSAFASINGLWLAQFWKGLLSPFDIHPTFFEYINTISPFIYGVFYYIFGYKDLSAKLIDVILGSATPLFVYLITKDILSKRSAKIAFILTMFFPSFVLWSITNLKDAKQIFLIMASLFLLLKIIEKPASLFRAAAFFTVTAALYLIRAEIATIFFISLLVGLYFNIPMTFRRKVMVILCAALLMTAVAAFGTGSDPVCLMGKKVHDILDRLIGQQIGYYRSYGLNYRIYADDLYVRKFHDMRITDYNITFNEIFVALFNGYRHFLFAPFPTRIISFNQLVSLPQTILWYVLFLFSVIGIRFALVEKRHRALIPLAFIIIMTSAAALVSGNIGTAFRHRDAVTPFFLIFSAFGIDRILDKYRKRTW